jgi:hypothetical protein
MDEVEIACKRILQRWGRDKKVVVDNGYHLNTIVTSVNSKGCFGKKGGALVVESLSNGLCKNDVILKIHSADGWLPLDSRMKVKAPSIWKYDSVDFRTVLDRIKVDEEKTTQGMLVRRNAKEVELSVACGPNQLKSRAQLPDCESVRYVTFGGIVLQTLSTSHLDQWQDTYEQFDKPWKKLNSILVVTHVAPGSPYTSQGAQELVKQRLVCVYDENYQSYSIDTIEEMTNILSKLDPVVIEMDTGKRFGTTVSDLKSYESKQQGKLSPLSRGLHVVGRGVLDTYHDYLHLAPLGG